MKHTHTPRGDKKKGKFHFVENAEALFSTYAYTICITLRCASSAQSPSIEVCGSEKEKMQIGN